MRKGYGNCENTPGGSTRIRSRMSDIVTNKNSLTQMKATIILNSQAGTFLGTGGELLLKRIRAGFASRGIDANIQMCMPEEIAQCVRKALEGNPDVIVAVGGDGTIGAVVNAMVPWAIPLGIIPMGTLNHFAKDAGIPLDLDGALDTIHTGTARRVDVGEVNGHFFLNNSSIGLYATIIRHRDRQQEIWGRGKWHAMLVACIHALHAFPIVSVRVKADGDVKVFTTPFVFIGNNDYQMNLFEIGKRERLDSGNLSLYLAKGDTRLALLRMALQLLLHRLKQDRDFAHLFLEEVSIQTMRPSLDVALDGEICRMSMPLNYSIHKSALPILLPSIPA